MKFANALAALLAAASSAAVARETTVKEDDPILLGGLLRGSAAKVPSTGIETDVRDTFEQQVKDAFVHDEDFDDEEDALEYDFEGNHVEAELGHPNNNCKKEGKPCQAPIHGCCKKLKCKGPKGEKTCQKK